MKHYRKNRFKIFKASGSTETFSKRKLAHSMERAGLPRRQSHFIAKKIADTIEEGSKTQDIFNETLRLVKRTSPLLATHYSLKKALFDLGPDGHFFEAFVARYFEELGFKTRTCQLLQGRLVKHEVDVVAVKENRKVLVECKFHNRMGIKNDVKIALYVKARRDDIQEGADDNAHEAFYLVSNTAFTLDAMTYATGSNVHLLGVNFPKDNSFLDQIKNLKLYPVTSLFRLSKAMKRELLARDILLAQEIPQQLKILRQLGMTEAEILSLMEEVNLLSETENETRKE